MQEANHSSRLSRRRRLQSAEGTSTRPAQLQTGAAESKLLKPAAFARRRDRHVTPPAPAARTRQAVRPVPVRSSTRSIEQGRRLRAVDPAVSTEPNRGLRLGDRRTAKPTRSQPSTLPTQQKRRQRRPRRKASPLVYVMRLLILGIGVGAIAGTLISVLDPALRQDVTQAARSAALNSPTATEEQPVRVAMSPVALPTGQPMTTLAASIESLTSDYSGLTPGVFVLDTETGAYLDLKGSSLFASASMIKVPVLIALLQDVDAGKVRLDESLTMKQADIATGSGDMQYQELNSRYSVLETAEQMIAISDNTATNMLIARLGGIEALNQRFRQWGLTSTALKTLLPDLTGTNITTPKELAELLARVSQGDLLSMQSRDRLFAILQKTETNTLLPAGLGDGATIAHKTGDIASMVGDVGLIDTPNGQRYIATIMVQRPQNDPRAQELIRKISAATYDFITKSQTQAIESEPAQTDQLDNSPDAASDRTDTEPSSTPSMR